MTQSNLKQSPIKKSKNRLITFNQTFQSSIMDKTEKYSLDKTLVKGIKQNDASKIVENGQQADLGQTSELYNQEKEVNGVLVNTRKRYDQSRETTLKVQQKIDRLKREKQQLQSQKAQFQSTFKNQSQSFTQVKSSFEQQSSSYESAQYAKDIRLQMSQVLRQEILYYKKNCFEANIKIVRNHNRLKTLTGQYQATRKVSTNCRGLVYSIEKSVGERQSERVGRINEYYDVLNRKLENNQRKEERTRMMESSMLQALTGKMPEEIEQKRVLEVHVVVKKMLKLKMERQMERYNLTETAFRQIQQNTTVKKADQLVTRFIQRQKNYGELLESISKSQQKITRLKQQKQALQQQNTKILHQKQVMDDVQQQKKQQAKIEASANIDILRERLLHNERLKNKIVVFSSKLISTFDLVNVDEVRRNMKRKKPQMCLKEVLERVSRFLDGVSKDDSESEARITQIYRESKDLTLPPTVRTRNMRIKTLTTRQETQNSVMEDHDVAYDDLSEHEYLNHNRRQIKKSVYLRNRMKTKAC